MKIYLAGNFPLMKDKEEEKRMRDLILKSAPCYRRLISFYYEKDVQTVLDLKEEELNESRSPKIIKRTKRS